nr:MAG TPA: hypothetical protein [Caudoviricetes sp.]
MANKQTRARRIQNEHRHSWHKRARFAAWAVILFVVLCAVCVVR